jgi:hypothetical protein
MPFKVTERNWQDFKSYKELSQHMRLVGRALRNGELDIGRQHYARSLALGVWQAISCGYGQLAAVEMGVARGKGLLELCQAAAFFRDTMGIDIRVYGFDNGTGLPAVEGYRDHPEIWQSGEFHLQDPDQLRTQLPSFAELIIGDIADTVGGFEATLHERKLAFVAIDVDFYSSTNSCFGMLNWAPECYLPTVPFYFDDIEDFMTYNDWCGEELAIREFNDAHQWRKFQRHPSFGIRHYFGFHVLDHKMRSGAETPVFPLRIVGI